MMAVWEAALKLVYPLLKLPVYAKRALVQRCVPPEEDIVIARKAYNARMNPNRFPGTFCDSRDNPAKKVLSPDGQIAYMARPISTARDHQATKAPIMPTISRKILRMRNLDELSGAKVRVTGCGADIAPCNAPARVACR